MNGSSHDNDPVANISQEYIEHLREEKNKAANALSVTEAERNAASAARSEAEGWESRISYYWERAKATDKKYRGIKNLINNFKDMAGIIAKNTDSVAEAVEIWVCMARRMSRRTDRLKKDLRDIKDKIANADPANAFWPFIKETEKALEEAVAANEEALKKSLDVLNAAYLLHISVMGKKRIGGVNFPLHNKYLKIKIDKHIIDLLPYFEKNRGIESNLEHLLKIFINGDAYAVGEDDKALCPPPASGALITFPLCDSPDGYYDKTKEQLEDAKDRAEAAKDAEYEKQNEYERRRATLESYEKALKAAEDAKKQTK